jgi:hypothetical protein
VSPAVRIQCDQKATFVVDMRPQDIVAGARELLVVNISNIVARSFEDATMSLRKVLVDLDLHAQRADEAG